MPASMDEMSTHSPNWVIREVDEEEAERISQKTGYCKTVCRILLLRGVRSDEDIRHFLHGGINDLHNPFLFRQMGAAVQRVKKALLQGEKIFIFGDRDADGVLSTAMLYNMLKRFDADAIYGVPEGEYGYGIEKKDIDCAHEQGATLIVTVDTGVSSAAEIEYAGVKGIDTVVIDHHVQPNVLPNAFSILNPKMESETYPFKQLSAGGVVLKFIHAFILSYTKYYNRIFAVLLSQGERVHAAVVRNWVIEELFAIEESISYPINSDSIVVRDTAKKLPDYFSSWLRERKIDQISFSTAERVDSVEDFAYSFIRFFLGRQKKSMEFMQSFIDLSAISTISDIMPLVGENRIIVREGLKHIRHTANTGLRVLLGYCDLPERELSARDVAWNLSPIINSAGRMGDALVAVRLFTTEDTKEANGLSRMLLELNEKRKEKGEKNFSIVMSIVNDKHSKDPIIVLDTDKAEHGVTGIIASKIARKYAKPAIVIVRDGNVGIGSGRGGKGFDLVSLVSRCSDLLVKYGGHESAVGFSIEMQNIESFRERVHAIAQNESDLLSAQETLEIDGVLSLDQIKFSLLEELAIFEPTGAGNPPALFALSNVDVINPTYIGGKDKNHIKFYFPTETGLLPVVGWGLAEKGFRILQESPRADIVFSIEDNYFRGEHTLQLFLHDLRASK